jgi:antitoxin (DNA-binding transcriptional repressor) of toxin-antitoxin stability system
MSSADEVLPVAVVKRDFHRLLEAAEHGRRTVILRHGRPVAALGPVRPEHPERPLPGRPGGLLALLGAFEDWQTLEADIADVITARQSAKDRPPPAVD